MRSARALCARWLAGYRASSRSSAASAPAASPARLLASATSKRSFWAARSDDRCARVLTAAGSGAARDAVEEALSAPFPTAPAASGAGASSGGASAAFVHPVGQTQACQIFCVT